MTNQTKIEAPQFTTVSLVTEEWREYDLGSRVYRIESPVQLITRVGGTTHRVVTGDGVVHCVPAPGQQGCVLRWKSKSNAPTCVA